MRAGLLVALLAELALAGCNGDSPSKDSAAPDLRRDRAVDAPRPDASRADLPRDGAMGVVIGVNGGTIQSPDGAFSLEVPAGALGGDTTLTIALATNVPAGAIGNIGYDIGPTGLVFSKAATIRAGYNPAVLMGVEESTLRLGRVEGSAWTMVSGSSVDTGQHRVSGQTTHLSVYGIIAKPKPACVDGGLSGDGAVSTIAVKEQWYGGGTACNAAQLAVTPMVTGTGINVQLLQIPFAQVPGTCTGHQAKVAVNGSTVLIEIESTGGSACFTACWDLTFSVPLPSGSYVVKYLGFCQPVTIP
jgi:hypothetical protein